MRFLVTCTIEAKNAHGSKAMIYFVLAFTSWLKEAFAMIEGNWAQGLVPRQGGGVKSFWAFEMPILINCRDAATLLKMLSPIYWNASVLRIVMAFLFMVFSGARGAPWVSKFGNPLIRKILVLTSAYVHPSVRTSVQTLGEGEGSPPPDRGRRNALFSCSWSKQYGGWFLVHSILNTIIVIHSWNEDL